ncbi:MAG: DUF6056 family protein [Acetatifactor muris]|nr:DUF6056 family protein [Acetatifactor muris]MCM1526665.1 DUF6056 family protein [Bacteroides sp.]
MSPKQEKIGALLLLIAMIVSLLPVMYLGRYNHPNGDDYYYGITTRQEWADSGNVLKVLQRAAQGVALEYRQWQGTYSAMFLMYLPPNIWGDGAYHAVTTIMLLLLSCSILALLKSVITSYAGGNLYLWCATSAVVILLCVENVPSQGETFFWYNGSMYYTGFFSVSLLFLSLLLTQLQKRRNYRTVLLLALAAFLAGGNYTSLLPLMILTVTLCLWLTLRRQKPQATECGIICLVLLGAFAVSALAPGNAMRQSGMWKIPAWKAVCKSLLQGISYLCHWIDAGWLTGALCLTPFFLRHYRETKLSFRYPALVTAFSYGVFCSMSCPTFYTMNSTGPARSVAIVYYGFILWSLFVYYYLLGALYRLLERRDRLNQFRFKTVSAFGPLLFGAVLLCLTALQIADGSIASRTTVKAVTLLANGEAKAYEEEYRQRMLILQDPSVRDVRFSPYVHQPDMLYVGDFTGDSEHPTNQATAKYFQKESIAILYE